MDPRMRLPLTLCSCAHHAVRPRPSRADRARYAETPDQPGVHADPAGEGRRRRNGARRLPLPRCTT
jgi:hypothetical protein